MRPRHPRRTPGGCAGPEGSRLRGSGLWWRRGGGSGEPRRDAACPVSPPPFPSEAVSLPTPHSPARVWVRVRAAASSRSSVRGAIAHIWDPVPLSPAGCVDFITRAVATRIGYPGSHQPMGVRAAIKSSVSGQKDMTQEQK